MKRTGSCLCGAVRLEIDNAGSEAGACHCGMCRKFSGGVYIGFKAPAGTVTIEGEENIGIYSSSPWAERAFCKTCGSSLFYRVSAEGPMKGDMHVGLGVLDDVSGIEMTGEIFIDRKPEGYAFAGETHKMTEAEVMALFAAPEAG